MNHIATMRKAIEASLLNIKKTNGYSITITADNVKKRVTDMNLNQLTSSVSYPKLVVMLDSVNFEYNPSESYEMSVSFILVAMFMNKADPEAAQIQAEDFIDDCIRLYKSSHLLGGAANDIKVGDAATDTGATAPEAVAVIRLDVLKVVNA